MRLQTASTSGDLIVRQRWNIALLGPRDGVNLTFTTPEPFLTAAYFPFLVYRNGIRLELGFGNDYTIGESGGPGTGYDTVILQAYPPRLTEKVTADYIADI